jgi:uncharacterized protein YyaL (SSP411 family)
MPNRLANESSPYLRQHADNPVDWYPWGEEAFAQARATDRPIFLSIGYAACHWCHVMAHESFADPETATLMNEHFVNIKVDREERPDLDAVYIQAVQMLAGRAGWPLSVFLTPDGRPFFGGTYFPPEPRYGMPSFRQVLLAVAHAWQNRREELLTGSSQVTEAIRAQMAADLSPADLQRETLEAAFESLRAAFDYEHGGWDGGPKFPPSLVLEFLLRYHHRTGEPVAWDMVARTLEAMARGGMYDQIGGGFHRYSVDAYWRVPHFEKMLYDNAQLARVYLHAWQVSGDPFFHAIAEETLDFVLREMSHPAGGFIASLDADSEGEEGKFYLWTAAEIANLLGNLAGRFNAAYGVTESGNFEGRNILTFSASFAERQSLEEARRQLRAARAQRIPPARDHQVLASWNGLMLSAFAEAGRVLKREDYLRRAERCADFLLTHMRRADGRLWHAWSNGKARVNGYLDDFTHVTDGLLELYTATFDPRWYLAAVELTERMIARFSAPLGFFDTSDDHEALPVRPRNLQDNALPSGNSMAAFVLLRLAGLSGELHYEQLARRSLGAVQALLARYPLSFGQWLVALDYALAPPQEVAIVGDPANADTQALLEVALAGYRPHQVVAMGSPDATLLVPLLAGRPLHEGRAVAYICQGGVCGAPVTDPADLRERLHPRQGNNAF